MVIKYSLVLFAIYFLKVFFLFGFWFFRSLYEFLKFYQDFKKTSENQGPVVSVTIL